MLKEDIGRTSCNLSTGFHPFCLLPDYFSPRCVYSMRSKANTIKHRQLFSIHDVHIKAYSIYLNKTTIIRKEEYQKRRTRSSVRCDLRYNLSDLESRINIQSFTKLASILKSWSLPMSDDDILFLYPQESKSV
jgi:hypothetical protein